MKLINNRSTTDYRMMLKSFEHWFQSPLGRKLLACERHTIDAQVSALFGYQQFSFCVSHRLPVAMTSNLGHKVTVVPSWEADMPESVLVTLPDEIGLIHDTADLVVLHHTLDFAASPHQTLRDVSRIIRGGGRLLIVGFNPLSSWGVRKLLSSRDQAPWNARFISGRRLEDWLGLLDFRIDSIGYHMMAMPFERSARKFQVESLASLDKLRFPLGAYYSILAQKQVGCLISNRPRWQKAKVIGLPVANSFKTDI